MNSNETVSRVINRRPLFIAAIAFGLGIVLGRFVHLQIGFLIAAAGLLLAAVVFHKKRVFTLVVIVCVMVGAFVSAQAFDVQYVDTSDGATVTGRIYAAPYCTDYGSTVVLLNRARIDGQPCGNVKLYLDVTESPLKAGDVITAVADVSIPKGVRNPNGFNERLYLLAQGVHYKAYSDDVQVTGYRGGLVVWAANARAHILNTIDDVFTQDTAPLAKAMLLGDKAALDEQTYSDFKDTGMAHVLAVSGLHAGILIAFVYFLLRLMRARRNVQLTITLAFIACYAVITGLSPSILRASLMAAALLMGRHFGRQNDTLNYLSLAFILSLILNPVDMFSAGFALSFGAVFGILTLGWQLKYWLDGRLSSWLQPIGGLMAVSVGASVGTLPILAATFNRISTFGFLINLAVIPLASAAIVLVFAATVLGVIFAPLAVPFAFVASVAMSGIAAIVGAAARIPLVALDVATPPLVLILGIFIALLMSSKYVLIKTKLKAWVITVMTAIVCVVMAASAPSGMYMAFLDVGQGDAAFVRTVQGGEYLIDGGAPYSTEEVVRFVKRNGITPEAAFISHSDTDHISGIIALAEAGALDKVYCSQQEFDTVAQMIPSAQVVPLCAGDTVMLDEYTSALVLYPYADTQADSPNEASLVLLIEYRGNRALFTGDISGEAETALFASLGEVDIYKAAHHGSKHASFDLPLRVLSPQFSVVSVGNNNHGHPSELAMDNLNQHSEQVYTTRDDYAVEFYMFDDIRVNAYGERNGTE